MARKRVSSQQLSAARVRHVLALDAANVMKRLTSRQDDMVRLFSRLRDRTPLVATVHSWFASITVAELCLLDPAEQHAVNVFHEALDELRWYLQYTEEMPGHVKGHLSHAVRHLAQHHRALVTALGPTHTEAAPVVDAQVVRRKVVRRRAADGTSQKSQA